MKLSGVSETLLVPLCARYLESERADGIIRDPKARELVRKLGIDPLRYRYDAGQVGTAIRTEILDRETSRFLREHPGAAVVNLGAGLCTRFYRVDDGRVIWFDIDLPEVTAVWRALFVDEPRHLRLSYSVFDDGWLREVATRAQGRPLLLIAEGLLMYFRAEEVRSFLQNLGQRFPGCELLFEAMTPLLASTTAWNRAVARTDAKFRWGLSAVPALERWGPHIQCLGEWYYFDYHRERWGVLRWLRTIPFLRRSMMLGRLRLTAV